MKLIWEVDPVPKGRYKSFQKRAWPKAYFGKAGPPAAYITAEEPYCGSYLRSEKLDFELTVMVSVPESITQWNWRKLKARASSVSEAKALAQKFFEKYPNFVRSK